MIRNGYFRQNQVTGIKKEYPYRVLLANESNQCFVDFSNIHGWGKIKIVSSLDYNVLNTTGDGLFVTGSKDSDPSGVKFSKINAFSGFIDTQGPYGDGGTVSQPPYPIANSPYYLNRDVGDINSTNNIAMIGSVNEIYDSAPDPDTYIPTTVISGYNYNNATGLGSIISSTSTINYAVTDIKFNPQGNAIAIVGKGGIEVRKWDNGSGFGTKYTPSNISLTPNTTANQYLKCQWNSTGDTLIVYGIAYGGNGPGYMINIYTYLTLSWTGTSLTKVSQLYLSYPPSLSERPVTGITLHPQSSDLAGLRIDGYLRAYNGINIPGTQLTVPDLVATSVKFSNDGKVIFITRTSLYAETYLKTILDAYTWEANYGVVDYIGSKILDYTNMKIITELVK